MKIFDLLNRLVNLHKPVSLISESEDTSIMMTSLLEKYPNNILLNCKDIDFNKIKNNNIIILEDVKYLKTEDESSLKELIDNSEKRKLSIIIPAYEGDFISQSIVNRTISLKYSN